jgi:hypothetical protein
VGDSVGHSYRERRSRSIAPASVDPAVGPAHARVVEREGRIGRPGAGVDRYFFSSCSDGSEALPGAWQSVCPLFSIDRRSAQSDLIRGPLHQLPMW